MDASHMPSDPGAIAFSSAQAQRAFSDQLRRATKSRPLSMSEQLAGLQSALHPKLNSDAIALRLIQQILAQDRSLPRLPWLAAWLRAPCGASHLGHVLRCPLD